MTTVLAYLAKRGTRYRHHQMLSKPSKRKLDNKFSLILNVTLNLFSLEEIKFFLLNRSSTNLTFCWYLIFLPHIIILLMMPFEEVALNLKILENIFFSYFQIFLFTRAKLNLPLVLLNRSWCIKKKIFWRLQLFERAFLNNIN